jgi:hypothetical protein
MNQRSVFVTGCLLALAALSAGIAGALLWGGELPGWLLSLGLALMLGGALIFGFTGAWPRLGPWLKCRPIQGAALVCLGVALIFVPVTFVASAVVIGLGARLVWLSACELEGKEATTIKVNAVVRNTDGVWRDGVPSRHSPGTADGLEHYRQFRG